MDLVRALAVDEGEHARMRGVTSKVRETGGLVARGKGCANMLPTAHMLHMSHLYTAHTAQVAPVARTCCMHMLSTFRVLHPPIAHVAPIAIAGSHTYVACCTYMLHLVRMLDLLLYLMHRLPIAHVAHVAHVAKTRTPIGYKGTGGVRGL